MTYSLIKPVSIQKPTHEEVTIFTYEMRVAVVAQFLEEAMPEGDIIAVDIETKGIQAASPETKIVGIGLASSLTSVYFDLETNGDEVNQFLAEFLLSGRNPLVGHNVFFDGTFLQRDLGKWLPGWKWDTFGLFKQLANEGWIGQKWGLKDAQVDLLGWDSRGDDELSEWLVRHGYVKNLEVYQHWLPEARVEAYRVTGNVKPDKGMMWKAPAEVLGYYCALDAFSTRALLTEVFFTALNELPQTAQETFEHYHGLFMTEVQLLALQQLRGIQIDLHQLASLENSLKIAIHTTTEDFFKLPDMVDALVAFNSAEIQKVLDREPARYKKLPVLGQEPQKFKKDGVMISGAWLRWDEKRQKIQALGEGELSLNWVKWKEKHNEALATQHFNLNSGPQRQWLFYHKLGFPVKVQTKSGQPATDKKALPGFGEPGKLLLKLDKQVKLLEFCEGLEERIINDTLHPQFTVPQTLTCRLGGSGGFNLQNIPKSAAFTKCFRARPGHAWVDLDFASLEQVVMAELSQDPTLLTLYGEGAKENDVYLYNGSNLPIIGPRILATGYNPQNPTKEQVEKAKKEAKKERSIAKTITLASAYGAGAGKIRATLTLEGVQISYKEAEEMVQGYRNLYKGVERYKHFLEEEWERRGGWVYNGVGRPVCCYVDKLKDIVNRVVQSTGHDILMLFIDKLNWCVSQTAGLDAWPVFLDSHDATTWECKEEQAEDLKKCFDIALELTNAWLGGTIKLKGDAAICYNLAEAKGLKDE